MTVLSWLVFCCFLGCFPGRHHGFLSLGKSASVSVEAATCRDSTQHYARTAHDHGETLGNDDCPTIAPRSALIGALTHGRESPQERLLKEMRKSMMTISTDPGSGPKVGCQPAVARETTNVPEQQVCALDRHAAREKTEAVLDEALDETFPASDPISITPRKYDSK